MFFKDIWSYSCHINVYFSVTEVQRIMRLRLKFAIARPLTKCKVWCNLITCQDQSLHLNSKQIPWSAYWARCEFLLSYKWRNSFQRFRSNFGGRTIRSLIVKKLKNLSSAPGHNRRCDPQRGGFS